MMIIERTENGGVISYTLIPKVPKKEEITEERLGVLAADSWFLRILMNHGLHEWDGIRGAMDAFMDDTSWDDSFPCFGQWLEFCQKVRDFHREGSKDHEGAI